ncbi:MAG: SCO family protein [Candidatus Thiodiazotropha sp. (ex Monitilora ramsayi)]|nr:SCO family protein [Candidatus Thiodiazotropha sp. (ex Monitilora ramsayi)]
MKNRRYQLTCAALFLAFTFGNQGVVAGNPEAYEKFDVRNLTQPVKMDCFQQHGRFLPSVSNPKGEGLQKISMQTGDHDMMDHSQHQKMMSGKGYRVSREAYSIPDVTLITEKGEKKSIVNVLNSDKPVMLNFIFTTCTTICPVLSASFNQVQDELGIEANDISMVSISIDPEYDTVDKLSAYAERFEAGPQWEFFTGTLKDVVAVEKAFDIYRGSKMNHEPITLMRVKGNQPWLRIDGLANANEIVTEYRDLIADAE